MPLAPPGEPEHGVKLRNHKCYLQVVNWTKHQHYKDRNPPWIKFHTGILEDPCIATLPDFAKSHLFGIWLLASRLENKIPADATFIGRRINATNKVDVNLLIRTGFLEYADECLQHASGALATCATETETEQRQSRAETEQSRNGERANAAAGLVRFYNTVTGRKLSAAAHSGSVDPLIADGVSPVALKLAIVGACLKPFHLGFNERKTEYLDPKTILRRERFDGHAEHARRATFRMPEAETVWQFWMPRLKLSRSEVIKHFFTTRDQLLVEEGLQPLGPAAAFGEGSVEEWSENA